MAKYHKKTVRENKPGHTDPLKVCTSVIFYFSVNSLSVFRSQNIWAGSSFTRASIIHSWTMSNLFLRWETAGAVLKFTDACAHLVAVHLNVRAVSGALFFCLWFALFLFFFSCHIVKKSVKNNENCPLQPLFVLPIHAFFLKQAPLLFS